MLVVFIAAVFVTGIILLSLTAIRGRNSTEFLRSTIPEDLLGLSPETLSAALELLTVAISIAAIGALFSVSRLDAPAAAKTTAGLQPNWSENMRQNVWPLWRATVRVALVSLWTALLLSPFAFLGWAMIAFGTAFTVIVGFAALGIALLLREAEVQSALFEARRALDAWEKNAESARTNLQFMLEGTQTTRRIVWICKGVALASTALLLIQHFLNMATGR